MIIYNQAFDYYHAIYRFIRILTHYKREQYIEVDRLRIWDFYVLFPEQVHTISLKKSETTIRELRSRFIKPKNNPYNQVFDNKKVFEKIRPYQIIALQCLASYGIIDKSLLEKNRVSVISPELLTTYSAKFDELTYTEQNVISLMTLYFSTISMFGPDGLKHKTKLMISRYDV